MTPPNPNDVPDAERAQHGEQGHADDAWDGHDAWDTLDAGGTTVADGAGTSTVSSATCRAMPDAQALAALVARVVLQDQAALAALYDALSGRVFASAMRITRDVTQAEEVMQDTFWQIWRQAPRFDAQRGIAAAWVMNMARSRALDAVRKRKSEQTRHAELRRNDLPCTPPNPLELLSGGQRDHRLQQSLATLDPLRRQLIALAYDRGLTQDEIAAHTGMPLGTVKSHLRRTLAVLRQALGPELDVAS